MSEFQLWSPTTASIVWEVGVVRSRRGHGDIDSQLKGTLLEIWVSPSYTGKITELYLHEALVYFYWLMRSHEGKRLKNIVQMRTVSMLVIRAIPGAVDGPS